MTEVYAQVCAHFIATGRGSGRKREREKELEGPSCLNADLEGTIGLLVRLNFCLSLSLHMLLFLSEISGPNAEQIVEIRSH